MKQDILCRTESTSRIPVFTPNPSRHLLLNAAVASFIALPSFAAEPPAPVPGSTEDSRQIAPGGRVAHSLGRVQRARESVGMEVRNHQGRRLGKVESLVLDSESGRMVQVLPVPGGFLGLGESRRSVAPGGFHLEVDNRILHLDLTPAGRIAAALSGAAAVGGITGGLVGRGIPEIEDHRNELRAKLMICLALHQQIITYFVGPTAASLSCAGSSVGTGLPINEA